MTRTQFFVIVWAIFSTGFVCTIWQTLHLDHQARPYRAAMLCRQDRNYRALMGERGLDHLCDKAGR